MRRKRRKQWGGLKTIFSRQMKGAKKDCVRVRVKDRNTIDSGKKGG